MPGMQFIYSTLSFTTEMDFWCAQFIASHFNLREPNFLADTFLPEREVSLNGIDPSSAFP
jgi:hypothetical protein